MTSDEYAEVAGALVRGARILAELRDKLHRDAHLSNAIAQAAHETSRAASIAAQRSVDLDRIEVSA